MKKFKITICFGVNRLGEFGNPKSIFVNAPDIICAQIRTMSRVVGITGRDWWILERVEQVNVQAQP